ncbi:MAG: metallophosphoesterase [Pseudomonadales bacterium]|jgi:serine/threonine protein phosphatase 1|nr:metallophosphoesterase [Pseudomonadales bacterium]
MTFIAHFTRNASGRDYAVGDIHGHFSKLETALMAIGFDTAKDRLFAVGDLIDRGPQSTQALHWLQQPWFHAVRGNHEDYACRWQTVDIENWRINGGGWFQELSLAEKETFAATFKTLPFVMEIETAAGVVGIAHADVPCQCWSDLATRLDTRSARDYCLWSRHRIRNKLTFGVDGVRALVVGHEPLPQPVVLGNVYHIDTRGWSTKGNFTLLDLHSLAVVASCALP